jgi:FtsP/CotA-like multicopper oxidase with cupredoxin domain
MNRREFIKLTGLGAAGLLAGGRLPQAATAQAQSPAVAAEDLDLALSAGLDQVSILPGPPTNVWKYQAQVRHGDQAALAELPGSYLGPIIRVRQGQNIRVELTNNLPQETIVHWHGLVVSEENDGHPKDVIPTGGKYQYDFKVLNRAGTYWYHPHPHHVVGYQVYGGLAGLFIVSDPEEQALGLPTGQYDLPLVIQDRTFGPDNQLIYLPGGMMQAMNGFLGQTIMVNGRPFHTQTVAPTAYRLRLLNGSNSRIYKLAWNDGSPLVVIGTDGGLLDRPWLLPSVMFAPAERLELWVDFSRYRPGREPALVSLPFDSGGHMGGMMGGGMMGGGMMGGGGIPNGAPFTIMQVKIEGPAPQQVPFLPPKLTTMEPYRVEAAVNRARPRTFVMAMQGMVGTINGREYRMEEVAPDEIVRQGDLEIWEFINGGGGMGMGMGMMGMMDMPHPMHIHGPQFQVLGRWGGPNEIFMDRGWKDTVLVMPGQRVSVLVKHTGYPGLFMYHCHNLEHEDMGMMRNMLVKPS